MLLRTFLPVVGFFAHPGVAIPFSLTVQNAALSHRVSTHIRWPFSRQAELFRLCVLVVLSLLQVDSKNNKKSVVSD